MTSKEFISSLARTTDRSLKDTQILVNALVAEMTAQFEDGNHLVVPNFGTFEVKKKLERVLTSPSTGQRMLVPPKLVLTFKVSNVLKNRMQKGGEG